MSSSAQLPDKLFFKIGEVARIVGVKTHVLRYWETEFPQLRPMKTRGAHRVYKRRDVELAMQIKRLLHDQGFTIPGARRKLKELGLTSVKSEADPAAAREAALRTELIGLRESLVGLLSALDEVEARASAESPAHVTVEKVSPATVAVPVDQKRRG